MKILVDAFGGDNSPETIIKGAVAAVNKRTGFDVVLVGNENPVNDILSTLEYDKERISVLNSETVISCNEEPTVAIKSKPDSSLCVAFKELKENDDAKALVSAGSTGAVLVGATLKIGRIRGVSRPALCPTLPTVSGGNVLMLDVGANADCKPENLVDFAVLGNEYAKFALKIENPRVALLCNGTEDKKGNALTHEVFPRLKEMKNINFVGNMEARDILSGKYDVVVCDGFSGNVALKSIEGAAGMVMKLLKTGIYSGGLKAKIGGALLKPTFNTLRKKLDYNNEGGALFLGVNKLIIKSHGSSNENTIMNSVLQTYDVICSGAVEAMRDRFNELAGENA